VTAGNALRLVGRPGSKQRVPWHEQVDAAALVSHGMAALWSEGNLHLSRQIFDAAYRKAEERKDSHTMALAALGLAGLWINEHRSTASAAIMHDRLSRALAVTPPDSVLALRLRARIAAENDYRQSGHQSISAIADEARRRADPTAVAEALNLLHHCLLGPDDASLRVQVADALIAESVRTGRRGDLLMGVLWRTIGLLLDGHPNAERHLTELRGLLRHGDFHAVDYTVAAIDVMLDVRAGDFSRAETRAKQCLEHGSDVGDADALAWYGAHMVAIRWFQGRISELIPILQELVSSPTIGLTDVSHLGALAVAHATAGQRREALGALKRITGRNLTAIPLSSSWLATMYAIVEAANLLDERDIASEAYQLLQPHAHLPVMASLGVACFGSVQHALGVAALTCGRNDEAVDHLRTAVSQNIGLGNWPAATLSRHRLSIALSLCPDDERRSQAQYQLDVAHSEANQLGMELTSLAAGDTGLPPSDEGAEGVTCVRRGPMWRIRLQARSVHIEHCVGMAYLAVLFANPGHDISAVELTTGSGTKETAPAARQTTHTVLDQHALIAYKERLAALQTEIDRCDVIGDQKRAIEAHRERDWLLAQLRTATGLGGRVRSFTTNDERARIAVGKAIRRALDRIHAADPTLGAILIAAVRTGHRCSYTPPAPDRHSLSKD
jgi:tetratricopeptide (TPR) repeat protein